jgi:predicted dehydrogenase
VVWRRLGNRFADCFDISSEQQETFANFYGIEAPAGTATQMIDNPSVRFVYIASNHASHTDYAVAALAAGRTVYLEKPLAVTYPQLGRLINAVRRSDVPIYAGYNRPFSRAIRDLKARVGVRRSPITLSCFVSGHLIGPDHWYRDPQEGTRICGNVGHWLDLAVHILSWGQLPEQWHVQLAFSDPSARDDNLAISLTSGEGDLVVIVLTSRCEPFEGINETINFQCGDIIAKIDDFRGMTVWEGPTLNKKRYWPKDAGHELAILQPFREQPKRDWNEVVSSSLLMLHITDMVRRGKRASAFSFREEREALEADVERAERSEKASRTEGNADQWSP